MPSVSDNTRETPGVLTWSVHRLRRAPWRLAVVLVCAAAAGFAGAAALRHPAAGIAAAAAVLMAASDYIFPVHFRLTRKSARRSCLFSVSEIQWSRVRRVWAAPDGLKLSPLDRRSRIEAYRGVFLEFDGNEKEVTEAVRRLRPETGHD
jgi:hypothetical protein